MRNVSALDKAREFRGAIWLEEIFPSNWRRVIILTSFFVVLVSGVAYSFDAFGLLMLEPLLPFFVLFGGLALLVGIWTISFHTFFLFYRLASPESHQPEQGNNNAQAINLISYPIAYILLDAEISEDLTSGFLLSSWGRLVLLRCGIKQTEQLDFLKSRQQATSLDLAEEVLNKKGILTFDSLLSELLSADDELKNFLLDHGVSTETFSSAVRWVAGQEKRSKQARRFWSRGRLKDITPIGSDFSYGKAYTLEKFSRSLSDQSVFVGAFDTGAVFQEDIKQTLNLLSRRRNNNALLIGEAASGVADIVSEISDRIADGRTADNLAGRHIYVLNTQAITTIAKSKQQLQRLLEKLFNEAANAGNVLLVIEDFPYFIEEAAQFGVNLVSFLEPFFEYQALPFLLTASPSSYHQKLEGNSEIMSQLGVVSVHKVDDDTTMRLLMEIAISSEGQALCTVGGLQAVVEGARRLLTYDEMPHAAVDLLLEILSVKTSGFVDELYVHQYLSDKTGVPTGRVSEDERVVLQTLESELNERIVGQNEATKAVAAALRRNRAGVENKDRPIGTFLFLGPTGVGKTETAKTLARIYFDGEESMRRLDMSEYSDVRSASELSGDSGSAGRLANMVREQPYGLLLLDEFEKAHTQVHDLFLQILDEGSFTDSRGRVVNLENMIIIATSNAVAQKIFSLVEAGDDLSARQDQIIDQLIETNTFRPELLNRFDQIVLYHPLNQRQLESVTSLLLEELTQRIQKQGYQLTIAPDVTGFIVESAYDPKFGARAIRREIQNNAETVIADKIIDQGLQPGDEIKLTVTDLKEADMGN